MHCSWYDLGGMFSFHLFELEIGVTSFVEKAQLCLVSRVFPCWGVRGQCGLAYVGLLKRLVSSCKCHRPNVVLNLAIVTP